MGGSFGYERLRAGNPVPYPHVAKRAGRAAREKHGRGLHPTVGCSGAAVGTPVGAGGSRAVSIAAL
jgi:hypothetical protein